MRLQPFRLGMGKLNDYLFPRGQKNNKNFHILPIRDDGFETHPQENCSTYFHGFRRKIELLNFSQPFVAGLIRRRLVNFGMTGNQFSSQVGAMS
jgi:hypothetical protein